MWRGRQRVAAQRLSDHARPAWGTRRRGSSNVSPPVPTPQGPAHAPPLPAPRLGLARTAGYSALAPPPTAIGGRGGKGVGAGPIGGGGWTNEGRRAAYRGRHDGGGWGALMATSRVRGGGWAGADWTYFNRPYPARRLPSPELPAPSPPITSL